MPTTTAVATVRTPATAPRTCREAGTSPPGAAGLGADVSARARFRDGGAAAAFRPATETLAAETIRGTKAKNTAAPSTETTARTQDGNRPGGRLNSSTHRLMTTTRNMAARLIT